MAGSETTRQSACEVSANIPWVTDDQILLQLGGDSNCGGEQRQQYISGLRQLLTDYRVRKVKDFETISQGIIDYRSRFHGDMTKILPLGDVTI